MTPTDFFFNLWFEWNPLGPIMLDGQVNVWIFHAVTKQSCACFASFVLWKTAQSLNSSERGFGEKAKGNVRQGGCPRQHTDPEPSKPLGAWVPATRWPHCTRDRALPESSLRKWRFFLPQIIRHSVSPNIHPILKVKEAAVCFILLMVREEYQRGTALDTCFMMCTVI